MYEFNMAPHLAPHFTASFPQVCIADPFRVPTYSRCIYPNPFTFVSVLHHFEHAHGRDKLCTRHRLSQRRPTMQHAGLSPHISYSTIEAWKHREQHLAPVEKDVRLHCCMRAVAPQSVQLQVSVWPLAPTKYFANAWPPQSSSSALTSGALGVRRLDWVLSRIWQRSPRLLFRLWTGLQPACFPGLPRTVRVGTSCLPPSTGLGM